MGHVCSRVHALHSLWPGAELTSAHLDVCHSGRGVDSYCPHRFLISRPVTGVPGVTASVVSPSCLTLGFVPLCGWSQYPCGSVSPRPACAWLHSWCVRVQALITVHLCTPVGPCARLCCMSASVSACVSLCARGALSAQWCFSVRVIPQLVREAGRHVHVGLCDSVCLRHRCLQCPVSSSLPISCLLSL